MGGEESEGHAEIERLRRALAESEERFRSTVEQAPVGLSHIAPDGRWLRVNRRLCEIVGYPRDELLGLRARDITHPDDLHEDLALAQRLQSGELSWYQRDKRYLRKDGAVVWVRLTASAVRAEDGSVRYFVAAADDITERRQVGDALRTSEERLRLVTEQMHDVVALHDHEGRYLWVSGSMRRVFGHAPEALVGTDPYDLVHPEDRSAIRQGIHARALQGGASHSRPFRLRRADGRYAWVETIAQPIADAGAPVTRIATTSRDVTERLTLEQQFREAQKMEAIGQLAGGVAHDFNNLLTVIGSYAELLADELRPGDPLRADVLEIHKASDRASELTRQLLAFSRKQVLQPVSLDLGEVVHGARPMLRRLLPADIDLVVGVRSELPPVDADPTQLEQVLMNLVVNARDAMPEGGRLVIEVTLARLETPRNALPVGEYVTLVVSDTGTGMDAATRTRLFEPFFTTKEPGKGTGLGLATVWGIVKQTGGAITVYSEPGEGTVFRVYFPRGRLDQRPPVPVTPRPRRVQGARVLVVEDDESVHEIVRRVLVGEGAHVVVAPHGEVALQRLAEGRFDLVLTDIVMPRLGGIALVRAMRDQGDATPVLLMSGYSEEAVRLQGDVLGGVRLLEKPFSPATLLERVGEALEGAEG